MTSETSRRAAALVQGRLPAARALGERLADLIGEPEPFVRALREGLVGLSDPDYAAAQAQVAPEGGPSIGVRWPLLHAVERTLRPPLRESSPDVVLWLAQRLALEVERELRLFALPCLQRTLPADPERSWQLLRRLIRAAEDWIAVDTTAQVVAQGVLAERFRWAELEQLVFSDRPMERRMVGAALARIPHEVAPARRASLDVDRALALVDQLLGDADDQVQKALSWALREWARVHPRAVGAWLDERSSEVAASGDGHRAWVIRDALSAVSEDHAAAIRIRLAAVRKRPGAPSTSMAAAVAAGFGLAALADAAVAQQGDRFTRRGA